MQSFSQHFFSRTRFTRDKYARIAASDQPRFAQHFLHNRAASDNIAACLRSFELELLSLLGYAVNLDHVATSHEGVDPERHYDYRVEQGPVPVERSDGPLVFRGATLSAIAAQEFEDADVLRAAGRLLRQVVSHHLGGRELQSRKVLLEVHRGRIAE